MAATPTEQNHDPTFRTIDMNAEVKKLWGPAWNKPDIEYEFQGRTYYRRTEDAAIYITSPDF